MPDNANAHPRSSHPAEPQPAPSAFPRDVPPPPGGSSNGAGDGRALASLICGICAIVFSWTVVISVALGIVAIVLALQCAKGPGKDAKAVAGRVCGIVSIVCSVAMLLFYVLAGTFFFRVVVDDVRDAAPRSQAIPAPDVGKSPDASNPGPTPDGSRGADIASARLAVETQLASIAEPDQATLEFIAREAEKECGDELGFGLAEIGIDPVEFASWLVQDMGYRLGDGDVHLFADGTGDVLVTTHARSFKELARSLVGKTSAYVSPERLDHGAAALDEATKAALNDLVRGAMDKATAISATFSVDVVRANGAWAVEHDEFDSIIDDAFDL